MFDLGGWYIRWLFSSLQLESKLLGLGDKQEKMASHKFEVEKFDEKKALWNMETKLYDLLV